MALPVAVFANRRALEMSTDEQPETDLYTDRLAYADAGKPLDMRAVLDALCALLGGTLVQRGGRWEVRAALELAGVNVPAGRAVLSLPAPPDVAGLVTMEAWLVADGSAVVAGQPVAQARYDQADPNGGPSVTTIETLLAPVAGVLHQTAVAGSGYPPGSEAGDVPTAARTLPLAGRAYDAAGDHATPEILSTPAGRLTPAPVARADTGAAGPLYWLGASQHRQQRAGWRFLTATGDSTYAENAFRQGAYFSDPSAWDASGTALLPTAGWVAGEHNPLPATAFPLQLVEAGGSGNAVATAWPVAASDTDARYLESELAPVAAGAEGLPALLSIEAKWVSGIDPASFAFKLASARLWVELVGVTEGGLPLHTTGAVFVLPPAAFSAGFATASARLLLPVLPGVGGVRVRVHPYTYENPLRARVYGGPVDPRAGRLLLKSVALQAQPQGATWKGADSYFASGAGGSVRPPGLEVFHVDAPQRAGLFGGVAYAFRRSVTRTAADSPAAEWARADDLRPAPLLASAVLDTLALRAHPSQALLGAVAHARRPPEALDAIDPPYDAPGRRFAVASRAWDLRPGTTAVSLVEIGEGEYLVLPTLPPRVQLVRGRTQNRVRILLSRRGGVRAIR